MKEFDRLVEILERLRAPGGCPWDAEQDHRSISRCMIEEAYELVDAIQDDDVEHLREELGDVLLQVVFHSTIAKDLGEFTIKEVINDLCDKLIHRHPHVFGDVSVADSGEVIKNWERLKKKEEGKKQRQSILDGIPDTLPSLQYARKIQSVVSRVGFDWPDAAGVVDKIKEEADEVLQAMQSHKSDQVAEEIGDLLFSIVNFARFNGIDPESALRRTNLKFRQRFYEIEKEAKNRGLRLEDMSLEEMDKIWESTKDKDSL
ncbi:MAG TPA: nucleoside triphosphate pyrophosphohydrolase [Deltaproteobacteria bacterium]|nr:nucleoside triphosphate pyrophosphohydrolase [Deltaproteobacteria bacterium]